MRTIRKKNKCHRIRIYPKIWLNINFGEEIFRLLKGEVMLDKTPYSDETLVPIENPTIEGDIFSYQVGKTLYKMDCSTMEGAIDLALIHISEPTRRRGISYAVICLKKKK